MFLSIDRPWLAKKDFAEYANKKPNRNFLLFPERFNGLQIMELFIHSILNALGILAPTVTYHYHVVCRPINLNVSKSILELNRQWVMF